ncbi:MAG: UDP-2,4-diacetamido-2,4,6-trideoxy-beta-L-altropyranose hydrolase [Gammaproteobacteria bacterium]
MTRPLAVFRADAAAGIGGGHVIRSLALADALAGNGWTCVFATCPESLETVPALGASGHRIISLAGADDTESIDTALDARADWLIVDHYGLDALFHRAARDWAERIAVIDDLADRRCDCDVLIDPTPGRTAAAWENRAPADCRLLTGPDYALLRPEFQRQRERALSREESSECRRLFVSFGFTDAGGHTLTALEGIRRAGLRVPVDVVIGRASIWREVILDLAVTLPYPVRIHEESANIAAIMAAADMAVGAGGGTALERCCLGLPSIVIVIAANQAANTSALAQAGAVESLGSAEGLTAQDVAAAVRALCADGKRRSAMAAAARGICDGRGIQRIIQELQKQ